MNDPGEKDNLAEMIPKKVKMLQKKWRSWQQAKCWFTEGKS